MQRKQDDIHFKTTHDLCFNLGGVQNLIFGGITLISRWFQKENCSGLLIFPELGVCVYIYIYTTTTIYLFWDKENLWTQKRKLWK